MNQTATIICGHKNLVGESPIWDPRTQCLHWVDIIGKKILTLKANALEPTITHTPDFPTALGLCESKDTAVVAFAGGLALWKIGTQNFSSFAKLDDEPKGNRLNEGAVAPDGSFWVGSMQTNLNPDGSMRSMDRNSGAWYSVWPDGSTQCMSEHCFGITNTLVWDITRGRIIFGDSLAGILYYAAWPLTEGKLISFAPFSVERETGIPDGSCLDAEGYMWNARYGSGCLLRIAPDGHTDRKIGLPATNITACTFGGPNLGQLFVTSASNQLPLETRVHPGEGALFALDVGVSGTPNFLFGI